MILWYTTIQRRPAANNGSVWCNDTTRRSWQHSFVCLEIISQCYVSNYDMTVLYMSRDGITVLCVWIWYHSVVCVLRWYHGVVCLEIILQCCVSRYDMTILCVSRDITGLCCLEMIWQYCVCLEISRGCVPWDDITVLCV